MQKTNSTENNNKNIPKISGVDLFCGVGGLTYGLKKSGIEIRAGVDIDTTCKYAYEQNNNAEFIGESVTEIDGETIKKYWKEGEVKMLVGCAPCQPFSTYSNKVKNKEKGDKWKLLNEFSRIVEESNPDIISMENVPNLSNKNIFQSFHNQLEKLGYTVTYQNVYCPDYGMAQKRRRLVLLASKFGKIQLIPKTHDKTNYKTVKEAIGDLEPLKNGQKSKKDPLHFTSKLSELNLKRIKASRPNGTWEDWDKSLWLDCHKKKSGKTFKTVYGRMSWNEPSPTITTQFYNYGTGRFGHPVQNRAITIREAAILQGFPKKYKFIKEGEEVFITRLGVHIGNAVPVDLGYIIGESIIEHLKSIGNE
ncbi:MAG: DNA cytosine methyltransferase [Bacteroidales bacterium]|jgi:DNA (cytosine-5)-methyltransferase 1|nr:DNA cytosine methyltransferase [Bacteroidales bacterium]